MIKLTKLNGTTFLLNHQLIQIIEKIPESKIVLNNKEYYLVQESLEEILERIIQFDAKVANRLEDLKETFRQHP
ncbi:flagellar FlbD family protein [Aminipila butyrica]|uniref:Flagellar FlbD family protein n=1 Tax=Aminipila butyrica TaxID=433296 RepID=A0A858BTH3_9FIRM|nr:flagellar FlbD family protein [Aminipila butyrica]QIB68378.1 flagellar FlbD family protein [Aminipila butyrica]